MPSELREELKAFERDLARVVTRFLQLYDRLEAEARPENAKKTSPASNAPPRPDPPGTPPPSLIPGYQ